MNANTKLNQLRELNQKNGRWPNFQFFNQIKYETQLVIDLQWTSSSQKSWNHGINNWNNGKKTERILNSMPEAKGG